MLGALILAGGESRRMGENKALIRFGDKPLLLHVVEKVMTLTREIKVVIGKNEELDDYTAILPSSVEISKDTVSGKGPLVGISAGMQNMCSEYALVLPCDSPFIKKKVLEHLAYRSRGADAAIPRWPNGSIEPVHAVYRISSSLPAAKSALRKKELLVIDMIKRLDKVIYVSTEELRKFDQKLVTFFNINRQVDLRTARTLRSKNVIDS